MALSVQALESAYRRLEKLLYNYLYRWFWHPETCQDLIQDAFERVWRKRARVDPDGLDALIWTTVINLARNRHKRRTRWRWLPLIESLAGGSSPEQEAAISERDRRVGSALNQLPEAMREVVLLEIFSGIERAQLADMLDIPVGTLASRKHAAVQSLKRLLEEDDGR